MRHISFALTTPQFLDGSKTVTRRLGWKFLKAGDRLMAVNKCQGLKPGEHPVKLGEIEIVSVWREPLVNIIFYEDDTKKEGFPKMSPREFIDMFCEHMKCRPGHEVTRIEFKRITPHDATRSLAPPLPAKNPLPRKKPTVRNKAG